MPGYIERDALLKALDRLGAICGFGRFIIETFPAADVTPRDKQAGQLAPKPSGIADARRRAGLLQREVAEALGVSTGAVAMWDTGERKPRADTLVKLAALYGTTLDELLREDDAGADHDKIRR